MGDAIARQGGFSFQPQNYRRRLATLCGPCGTHHDVLRKPHHHQRLQPSWSNLYLIQLIYYVPPSPLTTERLVQVERRRDQREVTKRLWRVTELFSRP
jgi:hypothetical protein